MRVRLFGTAWSAYVLTAKGKVFDDIGERLITILDYKKVIAESI